MKTTLLTVEIRYEHDVVLARQRARQLAGLFGFAPLDQTRIATAVSEIARNTVMYAGQGHVRFRVESDGAPTLVVCIEDSGPGIADLGSIMSGRYASRTGNGTGIVGAKRLMDEFEIESQPSAGTTVILGKFLPAHTEQLTTEKISNILEQLTRRAPQNPYEELQHQNHELVETIEMLRTREAELIRLQHELDETNRGVVALYAELDEKASQLQKASEMKTVFLSNMTHEFRTPLSSILSLSDFLLERMDGDLTPEQERQVTLIKRSAESLSELVNDLLDLARIEAGKTVVRPSAFHAADLFGSLRGMFRPLMKNEDVSLIFEDAGDLPILYTDEAKIGQILRNFMSNALKFTERGEIRVSATVEANRLITFSVSDTGIGIAEEDFGRIFEEFGQIEGALQARAKGTGLGLPLSRRLTQMLGGTVSLTSVPGRGSTFQATLPIVYTGLAEVNLD